MELLVKQLAIRLTKQKTLGKSHSTKPPRNGGQAAGYAALQKKFRYKLVEAFVSMPIYIGSISTSSMRTALICVFLTNSLRELHFNHYES